MDPCNVQLYVVPSSKMERALKKLEDSGYDAGPEPSNDFSIREGDHLEVAFRGNVKCVDEYPQLDAVFTTNLDTTVHMNIVQHDVFVQKSYDVYRGFVQLRKVTKIPLSPEAAAAAAAKKSVAGGALSAAAAAAAAAAPPQQQDQPQPDATVAAAEPTAEPAAEPAAEPTADPAAEPAAETATEKEAQEGAGADAAGTADGADADVATAEAEAAPPVDEPPPPMFEIKVVMLSELLITFPKVC